ncbi:MAG: site-specific integrase [Desulfarculaceae bacterium]|nr:site-specific integrase [Desulfarculaceae bacterium]MCF8103040.1 site-specific integrase [Desulfarculaceae bacterium]MCF8115766.1 site-specific integrase [Desulfarculaceae bacterium]
MSVYFCEGRGWKFDFTLKKQRYTSRYFKTKAEAKRAEAARREEILNPQNAQTNQTIPTDMDFLELGNKRLDFLLAYRTAKYYKANQQLFKSWASKWGALSCNNIERSSIQRHLLAKAKVSRYAANLELRLLRATFNWGKKEGLVDCNPTEGIEFFPVEKRERYTPSQDDIDKVIAVADHDTQDYLWTIRDSMGRMGEVNRLTWDDIDFKARTITLYTRKKRGGSLTPRKVPLTERLYQILLRRYKNRDKGKPWVFWHRFWSRKQGEWVEGPYEDRKRIMKTLCEKAGVRYFRFHPLRHAGASTLENNNAPIGAIQRILGHESRATTEIYLHSIGQTEREVMNLFERVSQKNPHPNPHPSDKKGVATLH